MERVTRVVLLGAGNVATHLGRAFKRSGCSVLQVYSRTISSAENLAGKLDCAFTDRMDSLKKDADLYVIAVPDDAISDLAARFPLKDKMLVHTSGTAGMHKLEVGSTRYGVLYPLQTFSKTVDVDFSQVPLFLEVACTKDRSFLDDAAGRISKKVLWTSSHQRRQLHLAAVFACNFVNHMYAVAEDVLEENDLQFDLLRPLIQETAQKVMTAGPHEMQTGPARRNDLGVLETHARMLAGKPEYRKMYNFISESIRTKYNC